MVSLTHNKRNVLKTPLKDHFSPVRLAKTQIFDNTSYRMPNMKATDP